VRLYGAVLLAALVALTGVLFGFWWAPFAVALPIGVVAGRARIGVPAGAGIGLFSWLVPLAVLHVRYGLGPAAASRSAGRAHLAGGPAARPDRRLAGLRRVGRGCAPRAR